LAGPAEYTYKEVVEFVQDVTTLKKNMIDVPVSAASFAGKLYQETINPFLTEDMIIQLTEDVVEKADKDLLTFKDLGIEPTSMDKMAFDYLHRFRPGGHFTMVQGYH
jgi:hypothetical protein